MRIDAVRIFLAAMSRELHDRQLESFGMKTQENKDCIHIEQLEVSTHIGVPDDERSARQRLTFSIALWPMYGAGDLDDQIAKTVNYADVCAETKKFVSEERDKLIETLANALALHLLEAFKIRRITVELRKFILPDVEFVSVTVTRDRSEK